MLVSGTEDHIAADLFRIVGAQLAPAAADNGSSLGVLPCQMTDGLAALSAGLSSNRAGIDDDGIHRFTLCSGIMSTLSEHGFDGLCFILVDLAAKG